MSQVWLTLVVATVLVAFAAQPSDAQCNRPVAPANGAVSNGVFNVGVTLTYSCNTGYTLSGDSSTTCLSSMIPSASTPLCVDTDECIGSPCKNGATCVNVVGSFTCTCASSLFAGALCAKVCDYDKDCNTTQFCLGSSESNQATAAGQDLITGTLGNDSLPYQVPQEIYPTVTSELTLFGKVRQEPGNNAWVIAKGQDSLERDYGLYLRGSAKQIWFIFNPLDRTNLVAEGQPWRVVIKQDIAIDDGQWHTVAVTFQPARARVEFFVDGELRAVEVEENLPNYRSSTSNLLYVGGRAGGPEFTLRGSISVARVYSVALTESQIYDAHREAMLSSTRLCTEYRTLDQDCHFCSSSGTECELRCGSGLTCMGYGPPSSEALTPPTAATVLSPLTGRCTAPCSCSTAADSMAVCASNGVTYENKCFALCSSQQVLHNGTCTSYRTLAGQIGL